MSVAYFDTSALLKQYVVETGSQWVNNFLSSSSTPVVFTSVMTSVEATCAFARRLREGVLSPDCIRVFHPLLTMILPTNIILSMWYQ